MFAAAGVGFVLPAWLGILKRSELFWVQDIVERFNFPFLLRCSATYRTAKSLILVSPTRLGDSSKERDNPSFVLTNESAIF